MTKTPELKNKMKRKTILAIISDIVTNVIFAASGFISVIFGLLMMCPYPLFNFGGYSEDNLNMYVSDFLLGVFIIIGTIVIFDMINLLLYHFVYKKCNLSKRWFRIPVAIITIGLLGVALFLIITSDYIDGWIKATWH